MSLRNDRYETDPDNMCKYNNNGRRRRRSTGGGASDQAGSSDAGDGEEDGSSEDKDKKKADEPPPIRRIIRTNGASQSLGLTVMLDPTTHDLFKTAYNEEIANNFFQGFKVPHCRCRA